MLKLDLEELILNVFKEDKNINGENTIYSQLCMITIKSLMPDTKGLGNKIDYTRFEEELKLLKYYKIENEKHLLFSIKEEDYFNYKDKTIYSRLFPIVVSNVEFETIEEELVKNILYTTGDVETLLEGLVVGELLAMIIREEENIFEKLKQFVINLSQIEFLGKYKKYYQYDYSKAEINFQINFERTKVSLISLLHGVNSGEFASLWDLLGVMNGRAPETLIGSIIHNENKDKLTKENIDQNYERMAVYVTKLRKSRIDPRDLIIKEYILPDIFKFKEGEKFFHSLLNNSKVIKKEVKDKSLTSLIQTRSGMYLFKSDPFN